MVEIKIVSWLKVNRKVYWLYLCMSNQNKVIAEIVLSS